MTPPPEQSEALLACLECGFTDCLCFDDDQTEIGCVNCDSGWHHGCCDDLCRGSNDPEWCDSAVACRHCNPYGEVL
ncbi:hypothetical protein J2X47_001932 [Sphingomonas sp. BE270]|jgi:hypothetical protein|uniref:hypothetical protein n=1 Tax=Sphingomonas sp. BE270 TaxID=2817726 RepID=UPI0028615243|nr:hypothetical protein [Sphingomonas sp. BE270]MDR7257752.1 hypothetical protein [Sphingomonas sp. BE270]